MRREEVLFRRVGDEILMTRLEGADFTRLSGPARLAWELLATPLTAGELVEAMAAAYRTQAKEIAESLNRLLEELVEAGFVEAHGHD
ncbi:MAG: PqqD family protein [Actinomycetota bacterium]